MPATAKVPAPDPAHAAAKAIDKTPTQVFAVSPPKPAVAAEATPQRAPAPKPSVNSPLPTAAAEVTPPPARKPWLLIGGIGAVAVAAVVVMVLLPGKTPDVQPSNPRLPRTTDPATPVPVRVATNDPVKPTNTPAVVATEPVNKPGPVTAPNTDTDDPDDSDTTSKPGKTDHEKAQRKAAKAAAKAAKVAAAKTAKPTETDNPVSQAPLKTLTAEAQRQNMLRAESRFKACAKEAWGSYVTISISVDNSGTVQKADLIGPLGASATGRCIADQIRKQHFPPFTEGSAKQFVWSYQIPSAP